MAMVIANELELVSTSPEETQALGVQLGQLVLPGDVIALQGDLGAGKTNLVQGLARGLGVTEDVNSPTFILANEYPGGRLPLYHIDCYRVQDAAEAFGFGLEDYLDGQGVTIIEWADRVRAALPSDSLWIVFEWTGEQTRRLGLSGAGERGRALVAGLTGAA